MRKACIITVYNSENCGSYWQAFTLQEFLRSLGYDVFFLKRKTSGTSHSVKSVVKRCLGHLKRGEVNKVISPIKQYVILTYVFWVAIQSGILKANTSEIIEIFTGVELQRQKKQFHMRHQLQIVLNPLLRSFLS